MISLLLLIFVVGGVLIIAKFEANEKRQVDLFRAHADAAAHAVEGEFKTARRSMNEAAGQSWRNLIETDNE